MSCAGEVVGLTEQARLYSKGASSFGWGASIGSTFTEVGAIFKLGTGVVWLSAGTSLVAGRWYGWARLFLFIF